MKQRAGAHFDLASNQPREQRRYRVFADLERLAGRFPHGARTITSAWLSIRKVVGAMVDAATRKGAGAGGMRNIAGTKYPLTLLERELADLHGEEDAPVFTSDFTITVIGQCSLDHRVSVYCPRRKGEQRASLEDHISRPVIVDLTG